MSMASVAWQSRRHPSHMHKGIWPICRACYTHACLPAAPNALTRTLFLRVCHSLLRPAVYLAHGTFDWGAVAKQTAEGRQSADRSKSEEGHKRRKPHMPSTPKRSAAAVSSSDALVKPAAVTNKRFKLRTSFDQTGKQQPLPAVLGLGPLFCS